jgi:hypothetical protein
MLTCHSIIEGVNLMNTDQITLHTSPGCTVSNANSLAGTNTIYSDCGADSGYTGCSVSTSNTAGYGLFSLLHKPRMH